MCPRILFVDDEQQILSGLKRSLRGQRKVWNMSFALGGAEALELTDNNHFDVVISDMRMPKIDGATLLRMVQERSPSTKRVILSGYSELEEDISKGKYSHCYLKKPCSTNDLLNALEKLLPTAR